MTQFIKHHGKLHWRDALQGRLHLEGFPPRKATFRGIAFPTKVTLGSFLPSVSYVVKLPNNKHTFFR